MVMNYSRKNPSPKFIKLIEEYKLMHEKGFTQINNIQKDPQDAYSGKSTIWFIDIINNIIKANNCNTLLDYGSGKGLLYDSNFSFENKNYPNLKEYWGANEYFLYDPSYKKYSNLPTKQYDCSICVDVLEHIPFQDLSWIIREILSFTKKISFFNIACFPALAKLHNGENAHITLKHPDWWHGFISAIMQDFPDNKLVCYCTIKTKDEQRKFVAFSINDNFKNYAK